VLVVDPTGLQVGEYSRGVTMHDVFIQDCCFFFLIYTRDECAYSVLVAFCIYIWYYSAWLLLFI
jgi:hypothetical protein